MAYKSVVYKHSKLSLYIIIVTFMLIVFAMLIIRTLYVHNEKYFTNAPSPVLHWSDGQVGKWSTPIKGRYIERFVNMNSRTGYTSISFWLRIDKTHPTWRNIFHFGASWSLEWNGTGNPNDIAYNPWEDLYWNRRPAVFIIPNTYGLHICHDTYSGSNNAFDISVPKECMVTLVFESNVNTGVHECRTYINDVLSRTYKYNNRLGETDQDALLYICDRNTYCSVGDFAIRDFKFFNKLLDQPEIGALYNNSKVN